MTNDFNISNKSLLEHYVDQMTDIQSTIIESQGENQQLRQDARTDGLNIEALQLLSLARSRNRSDGGAQILRDVINYAQQMGIDVEPMTRSESRVPAPVQPAPVDSPHEPISVPLESHPFERVSPIVQLILGVSLSAAMLWYLR